MKTPDDIKKGLAGCNARRCAKDCPYGDTIPCVMMMHKDACEYIQQLEAQAPKWISVKERLPERGAPKGCLIYADGYTCAADWSCDRYGDDWWFYVDGEYDPEVTHWMPLPEPPKEE